MPLWISAAFGFAKANFQIILIAAAVIAATTFGYKLMSALEDRGRLEIIAENLKTQLKDKQESIQYLETIVGLNNEIIKSRDQKIEELNEKSEDTTKNLGTDSGDQAPESLKELIKRLSQ